MSKRRRETGAATLDDATMFTAASMFTDVLIATLSDRHVARIEPRSLSFPAFQDAMLKMLASTMSAAPVAGRLAGRHFIRRRYAADGSLIG